MEKLFEKKNLGIPVTLLTMLAYLIGYYLTLNYGGLLVAVLFAVVVFALDFDDKVKAALKQSYIVGVIINLINLLLNILYQLSDILNPSGYGTFILYRVVATVYRYASLLVDIATILIFALFLITALMKKDLKLDFLMNILGEGAPKQQKPVPPVYNQMPPMGQPMYQQPAAPVQPAPVMKPQQPTAPAQPAPAPMSQQSAGSDAACPKCGAVNVHGAAFCGSCGNKLQ